jgi:hypothetical protein
MKWLLLFVAALLVLGGISIYNAVSSIDKAVRTPTRIELLK